MKPFAFFLHPAQLKLRHSVSCFSLFEHLLPILAKTVWGKQQTDGNQAEKTLKPILHYKPGLVIPFTTSSPNIHIEP
jgi:hypothetical protein